MFDIKNWDKVLKNALYVLGIIVIYLIFNYLSVYLLPFFLAVVAAYILNPLVKFFQFKLRFTNRVISVLSVFLIIALILTLIGIFLGPFIIHEINTSASLIYKYFQESYNNPNSVTNVILKQFDIVINQDFLKSLINQENIDKYAEDLLLFIWNTLVNVFGIFETFFIIITFHLYLLFILVYYNDFSDNWERIIPPIYRRNAVMLLRDLEKEMKIYFRGQSKIVLILCILFATGFKIVDLPLGIFLGILTGFVNFIPYLQLAMIPPTLILMSIQALESGLPFWQEALLILAVFAVVQIIQDTILVPKIMGDETGLNPAIILLSLSIFGGLFGLVGMLIALPVSSVIIKYYKKYILKELPIA